MARIRGGAFRLLLGAAVSVGGMLASSTLASARAASGDKVVNGCTIVENPTESHHTVCATAFSGSDLAGLNLDWSNLTGSTFGARPNLTDTTFRDAKMNGLTFSNATLVGTDMSRANLIDVNFKHSNLKGAKFNRSVMKTVFFGKTEMPDVEMKGALVSDVNFNQTIALGNLSGMIGTGVGFLGCQCSQANLSDAKLSHVTIDENGGQRSDFRFGTMNGASFEETNIQNSDFFNMKLIGTQLQQTTFRNVKIQQSDLTRANFYHATGIGSLIGNTLCHTVDQFGEEQNNGCRPLHKRSRPTS